MKRRKKVILPVLSYGEGSFSWVNEEKGYICYKKMLNYDNYSERKTVYGYSVIECYEKMNEKEKEFINISKEKENNSPDNKKLPLDIAVNNWMKIFKLNKIKNRSYDTLDTTYNNQLRKAPFAHWIVETITGEEIQMWLNNLADKKENGGKEYSYSIVKKSYLLLNMFMDYFYRNNKENNPMLCVKIPAIENKIIFDENGRPDRLLTADVPVLDDKEIEIFSKIAEKPFKNGTASCKYGVMLLFILWSYIRYGEAVALQWKDVDFEKKTIYIYKTYSRVRNRDNNGEADGTYRWELTVAKSKSGIRIFPLCDEAIFALTLHKNNIMQNNKEIRDADFIFTTENGLPIPNQRLNDNLKSILKNGKITTKITVHGLRHTGISYFIRNGVNPKIVSEFAGHADKRITEKVYYSVVDREKLDAVTKINKVTMVEDDKPLLKVYKEYEI